MARRRNRSDGGISLDSLMDALTNVVAVLILVLVLVQSDVTRTVQKFIDDMRPATPEEVAEAVSRVARLEQDLRLAESRLLVKPTPERIEEERRAIAAIEARLAQNKESRAALDQARAIEEKLRAERDQEEARNTALEKEIANVVGVLENTPPVAADTPTVVNIPNIRPIPEDARIYHAIVSQERVHIIDSHTPLAIFNREMERNKNQWLIERVRRRGSPDRLVYDGAKIAAHFRNFDWGNARGHVITIRHDPTRTYLVMTIRPNHSSGGTPLAELSNPESEFARALPVIRQNFKSILLYRVHTNSFNTYLAARELSEKANIPAGWEINMTPELWTVIPEVFVKRLQEPPAAPATPAKPRLKPTLD